MTTYRTLRDGTIESNRTLVRKIQPGLGEGAGGQLLCNLAHHSTCSFHLASHSVALYHHFPHTRTPFQYTGKQNITHELTKADKEIPVNKVEESDYVALI